MKYSFYLDTATPDARILLMNQERIVETCVRLSSSDHGQWLHAQLERMLVQAGISWEDIEAVFVMNGPGSYTGLRISLAVAKGICYAKNLPLFLFNKLDLLRAAAPNENIIAVIRARENEYFTATYLSGQTTDIEIAILHQEEVRAHSLVNQVSILVESGAQPIDFQEAREVTLSDSLLHRLSYEMMAREKPADLMGSTPFYLKNVHVNKINKL